MPYFEKQQEQQQIAPDMLEPPVDPKRVRRHSTAQKPASLWQPSQNASPLFQSSNSTAPASSSSGSSGIWDSPQFGSTFGQESTSSLVGSNGDAAPAQEKPFWKIW